MSELTGSILKEYLSIFSINNYVQVVDIFKKLIDLQNFTFDDVDNAVLQTVDKEHTFQLQDTIPTGLTNYDLNIIKRNNPNNLIQIFVKALTGNTMTFEVLPEDTTESVKCQIFLRYSIPIQQQQLLFAGKQLEDKQTLNSYSIGNECNLHLCLLNNNDK